MCYSLLLLHQIYLFDLFDILDNNIETVYEVHVQLKSSQRNVLTKENGLSLVSLEKCAVSIYSHNKFALSTNNFVLINNAMCNMLLEMWPQDRSGLSRTVISTGSACQRIRPAGRSIPH